MGAVFVILTVQALLGAFDNFWHHELEAKLPQRISARYELVLHASREAIYAVVFAGIAWVRWEGAWAWVLAGLLVVEVVITMADFIEEDLTRRLPPLERVIHTVLAVSYGGFLVAVAPTMVDWAGAPSELVLEGHGLISWVFLLFAAGLVAWSARNWVAVVRLHRLARTVLPEARAVAAGGPAVLVTGGTGFIGTALVRSLVAEGRRVIVWSRDARRASAGFGSGVQVVETLETLPDEVPIVAIVNLAGASIAGGPWTVRRRAVLVESRVAVTRAVRGLVERLETRPEVLVSASAVGFYGLRQGVELDETAPGQGGCFQSELCVAWEREARAVEAFGVRVVRARFGVVLGREGGLYPVLALAARLGLGAVLGHGRQAHPWVHIADAVGAVRFAMTERAVRGAVNVVAPELVGQAGFVAALAGSVGRRVRLVVPGWALRAVGEVSELVLEGQAATPRALLADGFRFRFPGLREALAELAGGARVRRRAKGRQGIAGWGAAE